MVVNRWHWGEMWVEALEGVRNPKIRGVSEAGKAPGVSLLSGTGCYCLALAETGFEAVKRSEEHQVQRAPAKKGARCRDSQAF